MLGKKSKEVLPEIFSEIHSAPPVDTSFVAGMWHKDRIAMGGYGVEARVFLKSQTYPKRKNKRFLILGRARSGTTLLTKLLNDHSQICCDGEVLKKKVLFPQVFLKSLARKNSNPVYGVKLLSYQMAQVHRMRNPRKFMEKLAEDDVSIIHLERQTFFQTLSLAIAQKRKLFHTYEPSRAIEEKFWLELNNFLERLIWSEALLKYERAAISELTPLYISYEDDLIDPLNQSTTLSKIFMELGVKKENVSAPLRKILPTDPYRIVEKYEEIDRTVRLGGFGHLLAN